MKKYMVILHLKSLARELTTLLCFWGSIIIFYFFYDVFSSSWMSLESYGCLTQLFSQFLTI